jgi:RNA polymerase sigma factor (sigma-70 family)
MDDYELPDSRNGAAEDVFRTFYQRFMPTLVGFLVWQGVRLHEATDIAQETMIKAYRNWSTIVHPEAWARRVASRIWANRRAAIGEEPVGAIPEKSVLLPHLTDVADWEQQHEILRILDFLPSRQRQVMAWTLNGYTPAEIAEQLGITPEAVRGSLKKARNALAAHLSAGGAP